MSLVRNGYKMMELEIDSETAEAIQAIEEILGDPRLQKEFTILKGQLQSLNNREMAYYRSAFIDHEHPALKRYLDRLWHRGWGGEPSMDELHGRAHRVNCPRLPGKPRGIHNPAGVV